MGAVVLVGEAAPGANVEVSDCSASAEVSVPFRKKECALCLGGSNQAGSQWSRLQLAGRAHSLGLSQMEKASAYFVAQQRSVAIAMTA